MPQSRRFAQCDVFSPDPTMGNPLAVVVDAQGLTDAQMQQFANWTNLAETTFLLPPENAGADYRVRIFTPKREMKFAGHPTLGSCMAWLAAGGTPNNPGRVVQECAIGLVEIDISTPQPAFVAPPTQISPMPEADKARYIEALRLDATDVMAAVRLDNGPIWNLLELANAERVLAVDADRVHWPEFQGLSLLGAYPQEHVHDFETRNIAPSSGMMEDPITGSLNAAIAHWLRQENRLEMDVTISQGTRLNRTGRVFVRTRGDDVLIGGHVNILIEGTVHL